MDKVGSTLLDFEKAVGFKPFKLFHRDWAATYKRHLERRKNTRTGKPLGLSTRDASLRIVKKFIEWLAFQNGYRSRVNHADAEYFNNNMKNARAARSLRQIRYPSLEQCDAAFRAMPEDTEIERRDKAMFALLVLTGARDGAAATLRLKHVDVVEGMVFQDAREVKTKASKTIETWFFPVEPMYRRHLEAWVRHLRETRLFGPTDALFPKQLVEAKDGKFKVTGFSYEPYANAQVVNKVFKAAFVSAGMYPYTPHSVRKTLAMLMDRCCRTMEERKAWSRNLGHEQLATTVSAYMPVSRERQRELIQSLTLE
ncbi:tyrosine-type recombinase/integrase [Amaricoccus tamworthensis]|uniref:tyrosine-type recombinase/integrase n=1 Tax=Amaricoccus tamworthensis TaxID=57002 RepID=UPI003C7C99CC